MRRIVLFLTGLLIVLLILCGILWLYPQMKQDIQMNEMVHDESAWHLMYQYEKNVRYISDGGVLEKEENKEGSTYIVYLNDQITRPDRIRYCFTDDRDHSILWLREDGSIFSHDEQNSGIYTEDIPEEVYSIVFSVYNEEEDFEVLGEGGYEPPDTWASGMRFSVLGDSISAYSGYITEGNYGYYDLDDFNVQSMWWSVLAKETGMIPCAINAGSGTGVLELLDHVDYSTGGNSIRGEQLSLGGYDPDVVFVFLGGNDGLNQVDSQVLTEQYMEMLDRIENKYPQARIYLCTYYKIPGDHSDSVQETNTIIRFVAEARGLPLLDSWECEIDPEQKEEHFLDYDPETGRALHVSEKGQEILGSFFADAFLKSEK